MAGGRGHDFDKSSLEIGADSISPELDHTWPDFDQVWLGYSTLVSAHIRPILPEVKQVRPELGQTRTHLARSWPTPTCIPSTLARSRPNSARYLPTSPNAKDAWTTRYDMQRQVWLTRNPCQDAANGQSSMGGARVRLQRVLPRRGPSKHYTSRRWCMTA